MGSNVATASAPPAAAAPVRDHRWLAFGVLCLGTLMIVLDTTIVNVALPSIRESLGFSEASLAWVVNAYVLTFGGFLLLGGRLGDLYGQRRLFLFGIVGFTLASLACGLSASQDFLVVARAVQGVGGAVVDAVALSLTMNLFTAPTERARAMGVFGFVGAGAGSVGVLLGGLLTGALSWHWVFLVNVPVGFAVIVLAFKWLPATRGSAARGQLDIGGAFTVTAALLVAVYAVIDASSAGWASGRTLGLLAAAVVLLAAFFGIEARVHAPLMPLWLFRVRNLTTASAVGVLWAAALFAWFFLAALYLQLVLGYDPMQVGLAFLPGNIVMAVISIWLSARLVLRFGYRLPLAAGLGFAALGLLLFARAPLHGSFMPDVLPGMILLGVGGGIAFNPVLMAAMNDVAPRDTGLASGFVNTSFMMGGALGLALLVSLAAGRTRGLLIAGDGPLAALNAGYHSAFLVGAGFAALAAILGAVFLRQRSARVPASAETSTF